MTAGLLRRARWLFRASRHHEDVRAVNILLLRVLFASMAVFLGADAWTHIATFNGVWDPAAAAAWCMWAGFSLLAVVGLANPLKMLPLVLLEIFYKVLWLGVVAYPLWSNNQLSGSPAEEMAYAFTWVVLAIVAMPWRYAVQDVRHRGQSTTAWDTHGNARAPGAGGGDPDLAPQVFSVVLALLAPDLAT